MEEKKISSNEKYKKEKTMMISLRLNKSTDKEIIDYLEEARSEGRSVQGEIKKMLKEFLKTY